MDERDSTKKKDWGGEQGQRKKSMDKERLSTMLNVSDVKRDRKRTISSGCRNQASFMILVSSISVGWWEEPKWYIE